MKISILDTTLRDGAGSSKVSFSTSDKLKIAHLLDELGVDYIEVGNPAFNVNNAEFFKELPKLSHARIAVFGSTCRAGNEAAADEELTALAKCGVSDVVLFGKSWDLHVRDVLQTTEEENLRMIADSIAYLTKSGMHVIFDAEHFYDGYLSNRDYAMRVLDTAYAAGASTVVLCDTNGGMFPDEIYDITAAVCTACSYPIGVHVHNDGGFAVSDTVLAVKAGAVHIQGTLNGVGERCGNANLATVIANLQLKRGYDLIPSERMRRLTGISRAVAEISNISVRNMPYVSRQAFSHKAGMHIDGVMKNHVTFEHINPALVGNERDFLVSEIAGRSALMSVLSDIAPDLPRDAEPVQKILQRLKELEFEGYQFDAAGASLELIIRKELGLHKPHFDLALCRLIDEHDSNRESSYSSVFIKVFVDGKEEITAADADGPVHAMDMALRKALYKFYPTLRGAHLTDYKVRVLNSEAATGATTRVLIETTDNEKSWTTIGVSKDIIEASLKALIDSIEYKLLGS